MYRFAVLLALVAGVQGFAPSHMSSRAMHHRRSQVQQQAAPSNSDADDAHGIAVDTPLSATSAVTMAASPRVSSAARRQQRRLGVSEGA